MEPLIQPKIKPRRRVKVDDPLLENELKNVVKDLGLPTDFHLELRGYSKTYFGHYDVALRKIVMFVLEEDQKTYLPFRDLLETIVHEAIHHYQYSTGYRRKKGVMHNPEFMKLEAEYFQKLDDYCN